MKDIKFDFNDVLIQPAPITDISSRSEINPFDEYGFLPLITAPMDTVIDSKNQSVFFKNNIIPCQPRGIECGQQGFTSYSLAQFKEKFIDQSDVVVESKILIDMANGHMRELIETTKLAREMYPDMVLMVGNVAHPRTYMELSNAGADYVRVGIGNGGGCLTTQQLGVGYPMGSLVRDCYHMSLALDEPAKIVADGGMKDYADIIKALALGADYVMIGSIFNKALESASACLEPNRKLAGGGGWSEISIEDAKNRLDRGMKVHKKFRGMSTKEVQKDWGVENPKTSEGIVKYQEVEYTIGGWVNNFESYLRSAMSYTNAKSLKEFCGEVELMRISGNALKRFKK